MRVEIPPGWDAFGIPATVRLKRPCGCGFDGVVSTQPITNATQRKMPTRCPKCGIYFELPVKEYGAGVGWKAARSATARRGPAWSPRDHQLFARHNWCCVYHEGSAEAALFRRAQIEELGIAISATSVVPSGPDGLFASARELVRTNEVNPNLF